MFGLFKKKALADVRDAPTNEPLVHYVHERKRLPDEGAQSYAFETLQLAVHSPIDGAVRTRYRNGGSSIGVAFPQLEGQLWVTPTVETNGIPSMAGGLYNPRQFTPDGNLADLGTQPQINAFGYQTNYPEFASTDIRNIGMGNTPFPLGPGGTGRAQL